MKIRIAIFMAFLLIILGLNNEPVRVSLAIAAATSVSSDAIVDSPIESWRLATGDWIVVNVSDTEEGNTMQFVRASNSYISEKVKISSGINTGRKISYLGMYYDPTTPQKTWEIRSTHQQNWWAIFGTNDAHEQLFLRLYEVVEGQEPQYSHYGFHTIPNIAEMITLNNGFNSWGCVVTDYPLLKKVEELYHLNGGVVRVITTDMDAEDYLATLSPV